MTRSPIWVALSNCPLWLHKVIEKAFSALHYKLDQKHVLECEDMVKLTGKEWNPKSTVRSMFQHIWKIPAEIVWFQNNDDVTCRSKIKNIDALFEYCESVGADKGLIFASCHIGNWEIGSSAVSRYYRPMSAVFKPHKKKWINDLILSFRLNHRQTTIPKEGGLIPMMRTLKEKGAVGVLIDQFGGKDGFPSKFLDCPTTSWDSVVRLSHKTKSPIIPLALVRDGNDFVYHFIKDYQVSLDDVGKLDLEKSILELDQALSELVAKAPEQWLWLGRRWGRDYREWMTKKT